MMQVNLNINGVKVEIKGEADDLIKVGASVHGLIDKIQKLLESFKVIRK